MGVMVKIAVALGALVLLNNIAHHIWDSYHNDSNYYYVTPPAPGGYPYRIARRSSN